MLTIKDNPFCVLIFEDNSFFLNMASTQVVKKSKEDMTDEELNAHMNECEVNSYWDLIPPEIQEYICSLASSQHDLDMKPIKSQWSKVCLEVTLLAQLKRKYTYGPISLKGKACGFCRKCRGTYSHTRLCVYGEFTEREGNDVSLLLGRDDLQDILYKMSNCVEEIEILVRREQQSN